MRVSWNRLRVGSLAAGPWSFACYADLMAPLADTTWVESEEQFQELIEAEEEKARKLGRLIRKVL